MGRYGMPTTLAICCPLPEGMSEAGIEACLTRAGRAGVPVSWVVSPRHLRFMADRIATTPGAGGLAVEVPSGLGRGEFRAVLEEARSRAAGIDAAWIRGPLPADHRGLLVDAGIRVACRAAFDDTRGSRRPAPPGWNCRSTTWGLWEVLASVASPPGLFAWSGRSAPSPGALAVVRVADAEAAGDASVLCERIDRWQGWASSRHAAGRLLVATLSELPGLIAGAGSRPAAGSVLKAA